jgi:hypothetical protein
MSKVIILDDRRIRQERFLALLNERLQSTTKIYVPTQENTALIKKRLENGSFEDLEHFQYCILHKSIFAPEIETKLLGYCKEEQKPLVLFSGGISKSYNIRNGNMSVLFIGSGELYSQNLFSFLKEVINGTGMENIGQIQFGAQWRLGSLLHLRDNVSSGNGVYYQNLFFGDLKDEIQNWALDSSDLELIKQVMDSFNLKEGDRIIPEVLSDISKAIGDLIKQELKRL